MTHQIPRIIGVALVACLATVSFMFWRQHERLDRLGQERAELCSYQLIRLQGLVNAKRPYDLRVQFDYHYTDPTLSKVCLGNEMPVNEESAGWCWITTGQDHCYLEPVRQLLVLYHKRWAAR